MDGAAPDDLGEELAALERAEAYLSAERRRLHQQIDFGFSTAETRARERAVSDERRRLHARIDSLRKLVQPEDPLTLGASELNGSKASPVGRLSQWEGIPPEIAWTDDSGAEELEH
jgi:hypothetical protein